MTRAKSAAEVIAFVLGWDIAEVREYRYQPTKYAKIHVYAIGDWYYCATLSGQNPPKGWEWDLVKICLNYGRSVYRAPV